MTFLHEEIPRDEEHRFLDWQADRIDVSAWARWFERRGVPHLVVHGELGWTIYKHLWDPESFSFCCGALT